MKRILALLLAAVLLTGCGAAAPAETAAPTAATTVPEPADTKPVRKSREDTRILISLPTQENERWRRAGEDLHMLLQNLCYQVTLSYADGDIREQEKQLEQAISEGVDCVIIAPIDSPALTQVFLAAQEQAVTVVSYDRLLMDTEAASYYISYDYKAMGVAMGKHIAAEKALDAVQEPVTVEFFMGAPEDNNALLLYEGIMEVLQPYLDSGKLVSNSNRTAFEDTCTVDWDTALVEASFENYLRDYYKRSGPDVICTVSDDFADTCIGVLEEKKLEIPLVTGLGATESGIANIRSGSQSFTAAMDMELLNEKCAALVDAVLSGKEPELNDTENCHNNAVTVPAYLCEFTLLPGAEEAPEATEQTENQP